MTTQTDPASWKRIWRENRVYFTAFLACLLIGFGIYLNLTQGNDILFFNQRRTAFGDLFFKYGTHLGEEYAYILAGLILLFYSFRHLIMIPVIGILVTLVANLMKNYFHHPRPFKWFQENGLAGLLKTIDGVSINMGFNSFPSGHTMSAFALFTFLALCLPRKKTSSLLILALPLIVGISRIYLIKHFLEDVLLGGVVGVILGVLVYRLQYRVFKYPHPQLDKGLKLWSGSGVAGVVEAVEPSVAESETKKR